MERIRRRHCESEGGPAGAGGLPGEDATDASVQVAHGPYCESLPLAGMTVGEVRMHYADRFDLHPLSQAVLDGEEVGDDTALLAGQSLTFMRRAGEKGRAAAR